MYIVDVPKTAYGLVTPRCLDWQHEGNPGSAAALGLKTGSTLAAGGCVLIAAWRQAGGRNTLIVAATFGQPGTAETILPNALRVGHNLVLALDRALGHSRRLARQGQKDPSAHG